MKRPSFQFYSSDWKGTKWITYSFSSSILPRKPACYVIYLDGVLSYIGQTNDLASRISSHDIRLGYGCVFTKWGQFNNVTIKARFGDKNGDWAMREIRLITKLQPKLNCAFSVRLKGSK